MPGLLASLLVFFTSAAVLVLEILAARLLAPYVGLTLETYTGVIGVILAGIAVGTWQGGLLADRVDPGRLLGPFLVGGGLLALATVPVVRALGAAGLGGGPGSVLLLTVAGFFGPAAVLSAVNPTVVKLRLRSLDETGQVVGHLSAVGTAGALAGTFVTGFYLVSVAPTTTTITAVALILVAAGVLLLWRRPGGDTATAPATLAVALAAAAVGGGLSWLTGDVCDVETTYHCARIEADPARDGGRLLRLDTLRHSYVDLGDPTHVEFAYVRRFTDVIEAAFDEAAALDVLHVGGGGFTMPRWLRATRPSSTSTVLEIDGELVDLAHRRLDLEHGPDLRIHVGDARTLIEDMPTASHDLVVGDAFGGLAVPWHLTTVEFLAEVDRVMRPGALYVMNVIDHPPLRFVRAEVATLQRRFGHVAVVSEPEQLAGRGGGNFVLVASHEPLELGALRRRLASTGEDVALLAGRDAAAFAGDAAVLRDDHAPVDQWITTASVGRR